jgi:DNA-binding NtrC family response regulator
LNTNKPKIQPAILVVDDELLIRDLLFDFFSSQGFMIHLAENGKKAVEKIDSIEFQVALVDLKMPEMNGAEFTSILHKRKPQIPVIIMTAYPSMNSAIESIKNGVFDYIVKPFKIADLFETVKLAVKENKERVASGYKPISINPA